MSTEKDEGGDGRDIAGGEIVTPTSTPTSTLTTKTATTITQDNKTGDKAAAAGGLPSGLVDGMNLISSAAAEQTATSMKPTSNGFETVLLHNDPTLE
jgi:hypothetical protein